MKLDIEAFCNLFWPNNVFSLNHVTISGPSPNLKQPLQLLIPSWWPKGALCRRTEKIES